MILFCDTSALVKLYVDESESREVRRAVAESEAVAVSRVAWVEVHSALARLSRESSEGQRIQDAVKRHLRQDGPHFAVVELTAAITETAGEYTEAFGLRAYDAIQLASAMRLRAQSDVPVSFACFDQRLNQAARVLGFELLGPQA
ncbi:PilT protein domain-containing protein [Spiribacter salinus M19-40]|uniref:Ribonuclease VapC n=1 Tax=Spiribacter salinus M19-40 TaxID=1260251 RepID=R4V667_9GAMM|nr:type II toxin-antitoxin system VapC family toxin [Spiribacter salinus]AGM40540.1 PilT protein domain-containing protein [Spiribacter salinus M19-40]